MSETTETTPQGLRVKIGPLRLLVVVVVSAFVGAGLHKGFGAPKAPLSEGPVRQVVQKCAQAAPYGCWAAVYPDSVSLLAKFSKYSVGYDQTLTGSGATIDEAAADLARKSAALAGALR